MSDFRIAERPSAGAVPDHKQRPTASPSKVRPRDLTPTVAPCKVCSAQTASVAYTPPKALFSDPMRRSPDFTALPPELSQILLRDRDGKVGPTCPRCRLLMAGPAWSALGYSALNVAGLGGEAVASSRGPGMSRDRGATLALARIAMSRGQNRTGERQPTPGGGFDVGLLAITIRAYDLFSGRNLGKQWDARVPREIAALLRRHQLGDFGSVGRADDEVAGEALGGMLAPRPIRNAAAIAAGRGEVVSRYQGDGAEVSVWTVFGPGVAPITMVSTPADEIALTT